MDKDGNGVLSEGEFTEALKHVLGNVTNSECNRLYSIVDRDRDQNITFEEYTY